MRYALIYGGIAGSIVIAVLIAGFVLDMPSHATSEWFGYLVMLVALSMIFVGVKRYRDNECGGIIRFGRALGVGLGIAAVAGVIYVIGWEIYVASTGFDLFRDYGAHVVDKMRAAGASQAAIEAKLAEMHSMAERYRSPLFRIPMTFVEIFPVGAVIALVSAAVLRNPRLLPARSAA